MASTLISNNVVANTDRSRKKKKKKTQARDQQLQQQEDDKNHNKWKSETQQQIYSSKLLQTLSQVHLSPPPPSATATATRRGRAVREAADRVLAVAAKGKTRWSRAILTNRLKLKFQKKHRKQPRVVSATGTTRSPKKPKVSVLRLKGKSLPAVQRKVRVLGRLVPGCRKQPLPVILEEATDYIAALEMQVRAMTTLANLLSGSTSSSASSSSAPPPSWAHFSLLPRVLSIISLSLFFFFFFLSFSFLLPSQIISINSLLNTMLPLSLASKIKNLFILPWNKFFFFFNFSFCYN